MFTQFEGVYECVLCVHVHHTCVSSSHNESLLCLKSFVIEFLFLSPAIPLTASPVLFFLPFSSMKYPMFFLLIDFTPCWSFFLGYPSLYSFLLQLSRSKPCFFPQRHSTVFQVWCGCLFYAQSAPTTVMTFIHHQWLDTCLYPPLDHKFHEE